MKQFFPTGAMLVVIMLIVGLAIIFRTQLLSSYDRTRVSIPTELRPVQTQPVPASIRTDQYNSPPKENNSQSQRYQPGWRPDSFSDFSVVPEDMKKRTIINVRLPDIQE